MSMEFTELADYPLPAGQVTEWTPRIDDSSWHDDDRRLTHIHEDYCKRIKGQADQPAAWLGSVFQIDLPFDKELLRQALCAFLDRHEVFRTTVSETPEGTFLRRTAIDGEIDIECRNSSGRRSGTQIYRQLLDFFESGLTPLSWPHCLFATVTDYADGERFLMVFAADHSVMDAYSLLISIHEIRRFYEAALNRQDAASLSLPEVGSHIDFSATDRAIGESIDEHDATVVRWTEFLAHDGGEFPGFPLPLHNGEASAEHQSGVSASILTGKQVDEVSMRARGAGHTTQSAILAALSTALESLTCDPRSRFVMPMHTRNDVRYANAIGWFVGLIPVEIDATGVGKNVAARLAAATTAVSDTRDLAPIPYPRIAELTRNSAAPRFVINYVDLRFVSDADQWTNWQARTLRSATPSCDEVYLWVIRSPAGLAVSARFPSTPTATINAHSLVNTFTSVISQYADTGTMTIDTWAPTA